MFYMQHWVGYPILLVGVIGVRMLSRLSIEILEEVYKI
jgi:hypothetical protein